MVSPLVASSSSVRCFLPPSCWSDACLSFLLDWGGLLINFAVFSFFRHPVPVSLFLIFCFCFFIVFISFFVGFMPLLFRSINHTTDNPLPLILSSSVGWAVCFASFTSCRPSSPIGLLSLFYSGSTNPFYLQSIHPSHITSVSL